MGNNKFLSVLRFLAAAWLLCVVTLSSQAKAADTSNASEFFTPTGYSISGEFLRYWQNKGGLAIYGYPITAAHTEVDPISGKTYLVQWFERNRFELHPENKGTDYEVLLGLLGRQVTTDRQNEAAFKPIADPKASEQIYFSQTGHTLSGVFAQYWGTKGGLALYGYPISQPFQENTAQGTYTVQYFERNRFELHSGNTVLLGLLGTQLRPNPLSPTINNQTSAMGTLVSYYNAINRAEYSRAYSYWKNAGTNSTSTPPDYATFVKGFANTKSVNVIVGNIDGEGAAGTIYSSVPTVIVATQTNGTSQYFYGCYVLSQSNVQIDNNPLPNPVYLRGAMLKAAAMGETSTSTLLDKATKLNKDTNGCV